MNSQKFKTMGNDLVFHHIRYGNREELVAMLQGKEIIVDLPTVNGTTPLHYSAEMGSLPMTRLFLHYGANPSTPTYMDVGYNSPLHIACDKQNLPIVQALIGAGADLNARNKVGQTPLHVAIKRENTRISLYLLQEGANPDIRDIAGCTPSFYARQNHMREVCEVMPPPVFMKPEEVMEHRVFVKTILGIKQKKTGPDESNDKKKKAKK